MTNNAGALRRYRDSDYPRLKELYQHKEWYGGVFDEARDGRERLAKKIADDPDAILVYERGGEIVGTISVIEDGRVAWLYRFIVKNFEPEATEALHKKAISILKHRGHTQILIYSAVDDTNLHNRYRSLGMSKGGNYTCFWQEV